MSPRVRTWLFVGGLLATVLGLGAIFVPGLSNLGLGEAAVPLLGMLTLLLAARAVQQRREAEPRLATTPDPEVPSGTLPPGEDIDEPLGDFLGTGRTYYGRYTRRGLRRAATAVLARYEGLTEAEADERLDEGAWTDDPVAATFLREGTPRTLLPGRVRSLLGLESVYDRSVRRTVDAIAAVAGLSFDAPEPSLLDRLGRRSTGASRDELTRDSLRPDDAGNEVRRETDHWTGVSVVALLGIGAGVLAQRPGLVLVGAVGIGYAAYATATADLDVSLSAERDLSASAPAPDEEVRVTLTLTNEGEHTLYDLRVVDGVPPALSVAEGSPRLGTTLRPGESRTVSYAVTARRGRHEFVPALVVARDAAGSVEREVHLGAAATLTCVPALRPLAEPLPLRAGAARFAGQVQTSAGGAGVEFFATREYRHGDPLNRIDWNRHARTGELATLDFREERAATVVVVVDTRPRAFVAPDAPGEHAVDRAVDAAGRTVATLLDGGNRVGLAAMGADGGWLAPATGTDHRTRIRERLATHPAFDTTPREDGGHLLHWKRAFQRRLEPGTQVVLVSPLCDDAPARFARQLDAAGYPATVLSPDPTADRTPGHRLARVARRLRAADLRGAGVPVVDWPWDRSLDAALASYEGGERR
ncbi:MAG: DUF58 domain-containing protein [Halorientalis sp.]